MTNKSLKQAIWVAQKNEINLDDIKTWSQKEQLLSKFSNFIKGIKK